MVDLCEDRTIVPKILFRPRYTLVTVVGILSALSDLDRVVCAFLVFRYFPFPVYNSPKNRDHSSHRTIRNSY